MHFVRVHLPNSKYLRSFKINWDLLEKKLIKFNKTNNTDKKYKNSISKLPIKKESTNWKFLAYKVFLIRNPQTVIIRMHLDANSHKIAQFAPQTNS